MGDYDLSGLSSRSFEKLIQALAIKVLGAGTVVFGDGPDGGREATFEGRMDYPSQSDPWNGYCVLQAKFRQRSQGTTKDGKWALAQLEKELKGFADPKKNRRLPDYYVLATNVTLSATQGKGKKDRVAALFHRYEKSVPLRGWGIWDRDQIETFLDTSADIRHAYGAWITPGDVLAAILEGLKPTTATFLEVMTSFLARELLREQFANLEQAGHAAEDKIPLAQVFVDLPVTTERTAEPPQESEGKEPSVTELAATLMEAARETFDPLSLTERDARAEQLHVASESKPLPGRYVLVGGPGQGKSTVGQFVCQLFRASLLQNRPSHQLAPEIREALADVARHSRAGGLHLPRARRFPVRIVLSELAADLNKNPDQSLLGYIAQLIGQRTSRQVSNEDLRTWLGAYPWLLVLDGLDEVPASTNRDEVLRKVEELWIDAGQCGADLLVLATTRPQGYNDDFSPKRYRHLWLSPLSVKRSLAYARRLVEVRYAGDEERQTKVLGRLEQASRNEATARLMRSPLQVTILATLVDQIGPPPQDRWQLFAQYYDVIYRRERERDIPAAAILRDHKPNIDAIHHHVGLLLQLEAEGAGGTEASLSAERFEGIVRERLKAEGYEAQNLEILHEAIIEAAANRLVFLVGVEADKVGFEIRSLQEFMAAEALMSGKDEDVQRRLRRIAPVASWRNTFLFAAGRCFSQPDKEHFRETIFTLCRVLSDEESGQVEHSILAGSQLALELLEDGIARQQPKYARLLTGVACGLLELPPSEVHARLTSLAEASTENILFDQIELWLSRGIPQARAAWTTLFSLLAHDSPRARNLASLYWPTDPVQQLELLQLPSSISNLDPLMEPLEKTLSEIHPGNPEVYPRRFLHLTSPLGKLVESDLEDSLLGMFSTAMRQAHRYSFSDYWVSAEGLDIEVDMVSLERARQNLAFGILRPRKHHPGWLPLLEAQSFLSKPSARSLARCLRRIARSPEAFPLWTPPGIFPWVLDACFLSAESPSELSILADRAEAGDLGTIEDWCSAEVRLVAHGVTLDDVCYMTDDRWPFDKSIATRGAALSRVSVNVGAHSFLEVYATSIGELEGARMLKARLAWAALVQLSNLSSTELPPPWLNPRSFLKLCAQVQTMELEAGLAVARWAQDDRAWLDALDVVGRKNTLVTRHVFSDLNEKFAMFHGLWRGNPEKTGLLPFLAASLIASDANALGIGPVSFEGFAEQPLRRAALLLEVAQGGLSSTRSRELASLTCQMAATDGALLWDLTRILDRSNGFERGVEHYLIELLNELRRQGAQGASHVLLFLDNSFRRQHSGLAEVSVWRDLSLPGALIAVEV